MSEELFGKGSDLSGHYTDHTNYTDHTGYIDHTDKTDSSVYADNTEPARFDRAGAETSGSAYGNARNSSYAGSGIYTDMSTYAGSGNNSDMGTYAGSGSNSDTGTYAGSGNNSGTSTYAGSGNYTETGAYAGSGNYTETGAYAGSGSGSYAGARDSSRTGSYSVAGSSGQHNRTPSGRYYSYTRSEDGGGAPATPARGGDRKKGRGRGRFAMVLAVILVFVLGASAGAMLSGRAASVPLQEKSSVQSGAEGSVDTEKKEKEEKKAAGQTDTASRTGSGGNTISRVEDAGGDSLGDTTVADVAEKVMPAIVSVYNKYTEESWFFGRSYTQEGESAGSGIIIEETDDELLIVTNNHVVEGADSLSVQFINEENCEAALKGTDVSSDLAVISVSLDSLSEDTKNQIAIAELGDSDSLRIGEHAIAIGNALGYGQSLTVGYISALNREITSENGITGTFIQTDAAINPGNSGGALLNSKGQVIGINSNKIGGSSVEGMGFAIPISKAIPIIDSLKTQESRTKVAEEEQGVLGIYGISVTSDVASAYGLPVGAYVEEIIAGGGAEKSDLQQGDIITAINGQTITGMEDLQNQLSYYKAGDEVTLTVQHPVEGAKYEEKEVKLTLSKRSDISSSSDGRGGRQGGGNQSMPSEGGDGGLFSFPFGF